MLTIIGVKRKRQNGTTRERLDVVNRLQHGVRKQEVDLTIHEHSSDASSRAGSTTLFTSSLDPCRGMTRTALFIFFIHFSFYLFFTFLISSHQA